MYVHEPIKASHWLTALFAVCMTGCAARGDSGLTQRLDSTTALTVSSARAPAVFARSEARYSRSARDYLYLGPVETNRQGLREYYLWVGIGTTLDRGYLAPDTEQPQTLYLQVRGEWMKLTLQPWTERVPGLDAGRLYHTAVKTGTELAARVTLNQLELMGGDALQSVRVTGASGRASEYLRWDGAPAWPRFLERAGGTAPNATASNSAPRRSRTSNKP